MNDFSIRDKIAPHLTPISVVRDPRVKNLRFCSVSHAFLISCYRNAALVFKNNAAPV